MSTKGPERARREERVAGAPQDPAGARALAEGPHERRLADPGLAGHEHEPPAALRAPPPRGGRRAPRAQRSARGAPPSGVVALSAMAHVRRCARSDASDRCPGLQPWGYPYCASYTP
jgi:hypothetical protein